MPILPRWKAKRELHRVRQQLSAFPEAIWEPLAQARHDRLMASDWPVRNGELAQEVKIAVLLIWQPNGIAKSVNWTLRYLKDAGYAPFVISNSRLDEFDRTSIMRLCWKWMERPNFGYDFGGYRDAIRYLKSQQFEPAQLVILNDSAWFPISKSDCTLEKAENLDADLAGAVLRHRRDVEYLESYFFSISGRLWRSQKFHDFWENFKITSNKYKTIRRGERGFSVAMAAAGYSVKPLFTKERFDAVVSTMSQHDLKKSVRFGAIFEEKFEQERDSLSACQSSADDYRNLIRQFEGKGIFHSPFPTIAVGRMGYPFLKKSNEPIVEIWRRKYVEAVLDGALPEPPKVVWDEILSEYSWLLSD